MRRTVLLPLLAFMLAVGAGSASGQNNRIVLVEDFSSVTCVNCPQAAAIVRTMATENPGRVVTIQYHLDIPGRNDPFYAMNKSHNDARAAFYGGFNSLPRVFVGGVSTSGTDESIVRSETVEQLSQSSPIRITASQVPEGSGQKVTVAVTGSEGLGSGYRLFAAIVESLVVKTPAYFTDTVRSQPYYNETEFHDLFRTFASPPSGEEIALNPGQSKSFTYTYTPGPSWQSDKLYVIAWVQDEFNYDVIQAGFSTPVSSVSVSTESETFELSTVSPNPARDVLDLTFRLATPVDVTIAIHDQLGRKVREIAVGLTMAGTHHEIVDLTGLPPGSYLLTVNAGPSRSVEQVQVVR